MANEQEIKLSFQDGPTLEDLVRGKKEYQRLAHQSSRSRLVKKWKAPDYQSIALAVHRAYYMSITIEQFIDLAAANYATIYSEQLISARLLGTEQTEDGIFAELGRRSSVEMPLVRARKLLIHRRWAKIYEDSIYQLALRRLESGDYSSLEFDREYVRGKQNSAGDPDSEVVELLERIRTLEPSVTQDDLDSPETPVKKVAAEVVNE